MSKIYFLIIITSIVFFVIVMFLFNNNDRYIDVGGNYTSNTLMPSNSIIAPCAPYTVTYEDEVFSTTSSVPNGTIIMWAGVLPPSDVWALCDGSRGTPDLRSRFIVGATKKDRIGPKNGLTTQNIGDIGGEEYHNLSMTEIPPHTHTAGGGESLAGFDWAFRGGYPYNTTEGGQSDPAGGGTPHNNMPPFYTLTFIMKLK